MDDDTTPLVVQILDIDRGTAVLETQVSFDDIKAEIIPQNEEFWLNVREGDPMAAKLRLKISYVQNEVLKWDGEVSMLTAEIKNDAGILSQVRIFIDQLRTPFGFLTREIDETISKVRKERLSEKEADVQPDHPHYEKEKEMEQKFDMYVGQVAKQYKIETIPWLLVTKVVVWIFLGLTLIQMLKRNCFLSLTVAAVAIYVLENPASISR